MNGQVSLSTIEHEKALAEIIAERTAMLLNVIARNVELERNNTVLRAEIDALAKKLEVPSS